MRFFDKFTHLCAEKDVAPTRALIEMGLSKSLYSKWKDKPNTFPSGETLQVMSNYFGVSMDYFRQIQSGAQVLEKIRSLCLFENISFLDLEEKLGFEFGTIRRWGEYVPPISQVKSVADFFNVPLESVAEEYFIFEKEKAPTDNGGGDDLEVYLDMLRQRPEMRLLLDTVKGATKQEVEENVRFLDALRKSRNAD